MKQSHVSIPTEVHKQTLWPDDNNPSVETWTEIAGMMFTCYISGHRL